MAVWRFWCVRQTGAGTLYSWSPIAQMADIGFKLVLLERLNQKWKQKHV